MRLRPPVPAGASAFTPERGVLSRWGLPILVGIAAIVVIVVLVIALRQHGGKWQRQRPDAVWTTLPNVPVGRRRH